MGAAGTPTRRATRIRAGEVRKCMRSRVEVEGGGASAGASANGRRMVMSRGICGLDPVKVGAGWRKGGGRGWGRMETVMREQSSAEGGGGYYLSEQFYLHSQNPNSVYFIPRHFKLRPAAGVTGR
jgi:hypothetical protein